MSKRRRGSSAGRPIPGTSVLVAGPPSARSEQLAVIEVTYEADKPKAFDDVVVRYGLPSRGQRVPVSPRDYYQIKWHTAADERFGFEDLFDPGLIGAASFSLLRRLQQAKTYALPGSHFTFLTLSRIRDGDPLRRTGLGQRQTCCGSTGCSTEPSATTAGWAK